MQDLQILKEKLHAKYYTGGRKSLSLRFPFLIPTILVYRKIERLIRDRKEIIAKDRVPVTKEIQSSYFVIARHSSPLMRKLGTDPTNELLQKSKVKNLEVAVKELNGLVVHPGETFSLWKSLGGAPTKRKGYQNGMLLSRGKVVAGLGGGLCQISNLLYWMTLHSDLQVTERHHHSLDVFKDSGRTIPFGTGATIFYPTLDFRFKNTYALDIILNLYLTDTQLIGKFLIKEKGSNHKYHVYGTDSAYYKYKDSFYRHNKLFRKKIVEDKGVHVEHLYENIFPTLYTPDDFTELY